MKYSILFPLLLALVFWDRTLFALSQTKPVPVLAEEGIFNMFQLSIGSFTVAELLVSFGIVLATLIFRNMLVRLLFGRLKRLASRTRFKYDDFFLEALEKPTSWFLLVAGIYLAIVILPIDPELHQLFTAVFRGLSIFLFFWALLRFIDVFAGLLMELTDRKEHSVSTFIPLLKRALRICVIIIGVIMVIDNLGYSVGGILATLGLGGAAFAFAAKDTIANLYGSVALALDRPFKVGDWIMIGDRVDGDVEDIGLRSTKVRTWPKTIMSIPNSLLANEIINNWSLMPKRRVKQIVGVTYETRTESMEEIVEDIRRILREDEGVNQEFILVNFTDFGESSLDILVYYFTNSIAWLEYMEVRQRINIKIMRAIEGRGLSIAFPSRTIYFEGEVANRMVDSEGNGKLPGDHGPTMPP